MKTDRASVSIVKGDIHCALIMAAPKFSLAPYIENLCTLINEAFYFRFPQAGILPYSYQKYDNKQNCQCNYNQLNSHITLPK